MRRWADRRREDAIADRSSSGVPSRFGTTTRYFFGLAALGAVLVGGCGSQSATTADRPEDITPQVLDVTVTPSPTPVPTPFADLTYPVQPGDLLSTIAEQFGITVDELIAANEPIDPTALQVGQELIIPPPS